MFHCKQLRRCIILARVENIHDSQLSSTSLPLFLMKNPIGLRVCGCQHTGKPELCRLSNRDIEGPVPHIGDVFPQLWQLHATATAAARRSFNDDALAFDILWPGLAYRPLAGEGPHRQIGFGSYCLGGHLVLGHGHHQFLELQCQLIDQPCCSFRAQPMLLALQLPNQQLQLHDQRLGARQLRLDGGHRRTDTEPWLIVPNELEFVILFVVNVASHNHYGKISTIQHLSILLIYTYDGKQSVDTLLVIAIEKKFARLAKNCENTILVWYNENIRSRRLLLRGNDPESDSIFEVIDSSQHVFVVSTISAGYLKADLMREAFDKGKITCALSRHFSGHEVMAFRRRDSLEGADRQVINEWDKRREQISSFLVASMGFQHLAPVEMFHGIVADPLDTAKLFLHGLVDSEPPIFGLAEKGDLAIQARGCERFIVPFPSERSQVFNYIGNRVNVPGLGAKVSLEGGTIAVECNQNTGRGIDKAMFDLLCDIENETNMSSHGSAIRWGEAIISAGHADIWLHAGSSMRRFKFLSR
ncbi:hypothetical protein PanWU01x14_286580 [Parasponia andersonii]|uniref:Uncharacterized protein n=1 Tax=Parasponia andersonii TaxID=3476 RepID=A0A2P5AZ35_PARAD|nr:hypothetical protein PanWU01x14_286580 [Parasponia andersonii]